MNLSIIDIITSKLNATLTCGKTGGKTPATPDSDFLKDLGMDSLAIATFVYELSEGMEIDLEYLAENIGLVKTVSDLARVVESTTKTTA